MMNFPRSSLTSRCSCDESIIVDYDPYLEFRTNLFTGCPLDKSVSAGVPSCPCLHKNALKDNASSTADALKAGNVDGVERERQGVYLQERMNLGLRGVGYHKPKAASLGRTDSVCSSNRSGAEDSSFVSQHNRLFQQLQKLRLYYLADLWAILREFKAQLEVYLQDGPVAVIVRYHIDILQRMIAPMVAEKKMLVSWLTEETIDQLRRQTLHYMGTFEGEKFQSAFQQLVARQTRWTAQAQAKEPDCIPPEDRPGREGTEREGHVATPSTSGKDPENDVSVKMTSHHFQDGHALSAMKDASFGQVERRYYHGRDTERSCRNAEVDICLPQCKRLKKMNIREVEFRQEADNEGATVSNRELGEHVSQVSSRAQPEGIVRSVVQNAPSGSTVSQAAGVSKSKDGQGGKTTSLKKIIRLFNGSAPIPCLRSLYEGICRRS